MNNLIKSLVQLFCKKTNFVIVFITQHIVTICKRLCVVRPEESFNDENSLNKKFRRHFLAAFFLYIGATLWGIFVLQWEAYETLDSLSFKSLQKSRYIAIRQMYMPIMNPQCDQIMLMVFGTHMVILWHFVLAKPMAKKYLFILKKKSRKLSNAIIYLNNKSKVILINKILSRLFYF